MRHHGAHGIDDEHKTKNRMRPLEALYGVGDEALYGAHGIDDSSSKKGNRETIGCS